jgi:CheY-like chemotaxis protein
VKKLKCILLVDDDEPTNYLNRMVLEEMNCAEHIEVVQSGGEAMRFLMSGKHIVPDLMFLDINMPAMDGWEFLEIYRHVFNDNTVTIMLTTSLNPDDEVRSKKFSFIRDYKRKPLTTAVINEILEKYFSS